MVSELERKSLTGWGCYLTNKNAIKNSCIQIILSIQIWGTSSEKESFSPPYSNSTNQMM